ncbi:Uncharacterised protein [Mycobacteroides abscessus subsp. abscessus]|nr:Uncharacterised protein [Mycobacteroides abscessus subsp. abscessus]
MIERPAYSLWVPTMGLMLCMTSKTACWNSASPALRCRTVSKVGCKLGCRLLVSLMVIL